MSTVLNRSVSIDGIAGTTLFGRLMLAFEPNVNSVLIVTGAGTPADVVGGPNQIVIFDGSSLPTNSSGTPAVRALLGGSEPIADGTLSPPSSLTTTSGIITAGS